jgi:hypothetical protein
VGRFRELAQSSGPEGTFHVSVDLTDLPPGGAVALPGETWRWQAWYRDKNPTSTSNFTDGVVTTFQ